MVSIIVFAVHGAPKSMPRPAALWRERLPTVCLYMPTIVARGPQSDLRNGWLQASLACRPNSAHNSLLL